MLANVRKERWEAGGARRPQATSTKVILFYLSFSHTPPKSQGSTDNRMPSGVGEQVEMPAKQTKLKGFGGVGVSR